MSSLRGPGASLRQHVQAFARQWELWNKGDRILVALSGGPDSTALLDVLCGLSREEELSIQAAHVNYGLRGEESDGDEAHCRTLCDERRVRLHVIKAPAPPASSIQSWARRVRHDWFGELAQQHDIQHIALGHTEGDRAETVLLQLMRGSARRGLSGMLPRRGKLIRPLLTARRETIEAYLTGQEITFRIDSSNASSKYKRNRVRHEVLPLLSDVFSRDAVGSLAESAQVFALESDFLEQQTAAHLHLLESAGGSLRIPVASLALLHPAVALRLLDVALSKLRLPAGRARLLRLLQLAGTKPGRRLKLGDLGTAERGKDHLWLYLTRAALPDVPVRIPGITPLPDGSHLHVERTTATTRFPRGDFEMCARLPRPEAPLTLRPARPGDRIRPFGGQGSRLVFDLLSEAGVPRFLRTQSWVLEDPGHILWLLGHRPAEEIRVLPGAEEVYQFRWETEARR